MDERVLIEGVGQDLSKSSQRCLGKQDSLTRAGWAFMNGGKGKAWTSLRDGDRSRWHMLQVAGNSQGKACGVHICASCTQHADAGLPPVSRVVNGAANARLCATYLACSHHGATTPILLFFNEQGTSTVCAVTMENCGQNIELACI